MKYASLSSFVELLFGRLQRANLWKNICKHNSISIDMCYYFLKIGLPTAEIAPTEAQKNLPVLKMKNPKCCNTS